MRFFKEYSILYALAFILLSISCNREKMVVPEGMIQGEDFVNLLVEIHITDGIIHKKPLTRMEKEDLTFSYYPGILKKYGLNRAEFDSTIYFYAQYPDEFVKIYDEVLKILSIKETEYPIDTTLMEK